MSLDLDAIKRRLAELQEQGTQRQQNDDLLFTIADGEKKAVRIVDYPFGDNPFVELWFHYNVGPLRTVLCPKMNSGKECPICDVVKKLYTEGTNESKELASKIRAKMRVYSPVIDRSEADLKIKLWGYSKTIYETLMGYILDEDYQEVDSNNKKCTIVDLKLGRDITITKTAPSGNNKYPSIDIKVKPRPSEAHDNINELLEEVKKTIPDLINTGGPWTIYTEKELIDVIDKIDSNDGGDSNVMNEVNSTTKQEVEDLQKKLDELLKS